MDNVPIHFIPENNLGLEASHLETFVDQVGLDNIKTFYQKKRPGICKTAKETSGYPIIVEDYLINRLLRFDSRLFTVTRKATVESIKKELRSQLERVRVETQEPTDVFKRRRVTYTGKVGTSLQDDMYIVLAMCLYWGPVAIRRSMGSQLPAF